MAVNTIECDGYVLPFARIVGLPVDMAGMQLKRLEKEGIGGYAFKEMGQKAEESFLVTVGYGATPGIALGMVADQKSFQGAQVTIVDGHGFAWSGYVVLRVRVMEMKVVPGLLWYGTWYSSPVRVISQWTVQYPYETG